MKEMKMREDLIILFFISSFILIWNLWTGSLTSWDAAVYAQVAREMLNSHNYIDLTWAGQTWSDKPPLYMWFTVMFYKIFGINEFAARFFSALSGAGTVIITYLFAYRLFSKQVAWACALILLSTLHFIWSAKVGMLDMTLTFFIVLCLFLFELGEEKKIYLFFSMLAFACAFLTKGTGALLAPIILLFYIILAKKFTILKEPAFIWGVLFSLLILVGWHGLAYLHYGKDFISGYFIKHLLVRTTTVTDAHYGGIFTYFKVLPNKGRPWAAIALFILPFADWRIFAKKEENLLLPVVWALSVFTVFSLVRTKLHWYIIPIYPALSILVGWGLNKIFKKYTILLVSIIACVSLLYLSYAKGIFNLDQSPEAKRFAVTVKNMLPKDKRVFVFNVGDPGLRFYFADIGENISGSRLKELLKEQGSYILFERREFDAHQNLGLAIAAQTQDFVLVKTKSAD